MGREALRSGELRVKGTRAHLGQARLHGARSAAWDSTPRGLPAPCSPAGREVAGWERGRTNANSVTNLPCALEETLTLWALGSLSRKLRVKELSSSPEWFQHLNHLKNCF